jgi:hypothetical protein
LGADLIKTKTSQGINIALRKSLYSSWRSTLMKKSKTISTKRILKSTLLPFTKYVISFSFSLQKVSLLAL